MKLKSALVEAIAQEIRTRTDYLPTKTLSSVYFGGGTPSLLTAAELDLIFDAIHDVYTIEDSAEITLEANPDDLTPAKIDIFKASPINRLSIGIQSFFEEDLQLWNRAHNAQEAERSIQLSQDAGFDNITIDLIYGSPLLTDQKWHTNIDKVLQFGVPHVSAYSLTIEERTALWHQVHKGKTLPPDENVSARQFEILVDRLTKADFIHYEISNFGKEGYIANHNSSYWKRKHYLGVGPAAHSFNGKSRSWNISNNPKYIKAIDRLVNEAVTTDLFDTEHLTMYEQYNEYVLTSLRTIWGCDIREIEAIAPHCKQFFEAQSMVWLLEGKMQRKNNIFTLTQEGKLIADFIAAELFL